MYLRLFLLVYIITVVNGETAILFGATGTVGNEVLRAILATSAWDKIIVVSRRFPPKVTDLFNQDGKGKNIIQIQAPDLSDIDTHNELQKMKADSCFIAVGAASPYDMSLKSWLTIEVDMIASMARLCNNMKVQSISLLSAADTPDDAVAYSAEEIHEYGDSSIGWIGMLIQYGRVMGLKESVVIRYSSDIPNVRIFQPSTIITKEIRYGWVDWILFRLHKILDPIIPEYYHSIRVESLGMAIVTDAIEMMHTNEDDDEEKDSVSVLRLSYGDYVKILGKEVDGTGVAVNVTNDEL